MYGEEAGKPNFVITYALVTLTPGENCVEMLLLPIRGSDGEDQISFVTITV